MLDAFIDRGEEAYKPYLFESLAALSLARHLSSESLLIDAYLKNRGEPLVTEVGTGRLEEIQGAAWAGTKEFFQRMPELFPPEKSSHQRLVLLPALVDRLTDSILMSFPGALGNLLSHAVLLVASGL